MTPVTFTPSGTPATFTPGASPATFAMPTPDTGNVDLQVANNSGSPVWIAFAGGAAVGPNAAGNLIVQSGATVLLTANATTLQAAAGRPGVLNTQAGGYGAATALTAVSQGMGGTVTVTRGTAMAGEAF